MRNDLEIDHLAEVIRIKKEHEAENEAKQDAYETELRQSKESFEKELKQSKESFEAELKQSKESFEEELRLSKESYEARLIRSEDALSEQRKVNQQLTREHDDELQAHKRTKQQLQTATRKCENAITKCEAMEAKFQPLNEECKKAKQDLINKDEELKILKGKYSYRKREIEDLKKRLDQRSFLDRLPRWLPLLACFLIGALVCGAVWAISAHVIGEGKGEEDIVIEEPNQPSTLTEPEKPSTSTVDPLKETVNLDELQELITYAENLNASSYTDKTWASVATAIKQAKQVQFFLMPKQELVDYYKNKLQKAMDGLEEKPKYNSKWDDPAFRAQIEMAFPELQFLDPMNYSLPEPLGNNAKAKLVSVFEINKESTASEEEEQRNEQDQAQTDEQQEPEDNDSEAPDLTAEQPESEIQNKEALPCAMILQGEATEFDLMQIESASVIARVNDQILVAFGEEDILLQATKVFAYAMDLVVSMDDSSSTSDSEANYITSYGKSILLYHIDEKTWLDLAPDAENNTWWYSINDWSTEEEDLSNARNELNTKPIPMMILRSDSSLAAIFNYGDNSALATELVQVVQKETIRAWQTEAYVLVQKDMTKQPSALDEDTGNTNESESESES